MATVAGHRRMASQRTEPQAEPQIEPPVLLEPTADPAAELTPELPAEARTEVLTDAAPEEPAGAELANGTDGVRRRLPRPLTVVLALALVALLVVAAVCAFAVRHDREDVAGGDVALAAARTSAATILSYDYRHLDANFAAATALTTGQLRTDYQATTSKAVGQLAAQTHAVVSAKVVAGGVVSSTATTATVLLFVDQTTTSNRLSAPTMDQNRVQLTMRKVGSHWLVSGLKAL